MIDSIVDFGKRHNYLHDCDHTPSGKTVCVNVAELKHFLDIKRKEAEKEYKNCKEV